MTGHVLGFQSPALNGAFPQCKNASSTLTLVVTGPEASIIIHFSSET